MSFLANSLIAAGLLLSSIAFFVQAETDSAEPALEQTMGNSTRDKHILLCSCISAQDVIGHLPCDEVWKNHAAEKFEDNLQILIKYGVPNNWDTVEKLARMEAQCTLFEAVSIPLFDCYTAEITNANRTLPVEQLRLNWLFNNAAGNDKILEKYGALVAGDNQRKAALETTFIRCLRSLIPQGVSVPTKTVDVSELVRLH
uniref:Secreted protein n=1 Tax=Cacopsylla melanoneura TaxID=428564 RepID=A0A8D8XRK0_9HEMI